MLPLLALGCLVAARSFKPPGASIQEIQSLSDLDALLAEDAERQSMDPIVFGQFMKKQSYGFQAYKTVASKLGYGLTFIYGIDSADLLVRYPMQPKKQSSVHLVRRFDSDWRRLPNNGTMAVAFEGDTTSDPQLFKFLIRNALPPVVPATGSAMQSTMFKLGFTLASESVAAFIFTVKDSKKQTLTKDVLLDIGHIIRAESIVCFHVSLAAEPDGKADGPDLLDVVGLKHSDVVQWGIMVGGIEPKEGKRYAYPPYQGPVTVESMTDFAKNLPKYVSLKGFEKQKEQPRQRRKVEKKRVERADL